MATQTLPNNLKSYGSVIQILSILTYQLVFKNYGGISLIISHLIGQIIDVKITRSKRNSLDGAL